DPVRLVTNMTATVDVTDNERIAGWVSDQLLKVLRTHVTTQIIRNGWPILGLMAYSAEIEQATIDAANGQLAGGFQNYAAGEMALGAGQGMAKGGGAADGAFLGAGFGLASAFGAQQAQAQQAQQAQAAQQAAAQYGVPYGQGAPYAPPQPPSQPQASPGPACASCQAQNPAGAKFCMGCGQALAPAVQHCTECGTELPP